MRIMGLDYGSRTVGVALTDALGVTAQPLETITRDRPSKIRKTLARIEQIISENEVELIVLGLPVNIDGSEGERCEHTRAFGDTLEKRTGISVVYEDERLTTIQSNEILEEMGVKKKDRKTYIDKIAATVILEQYLHEITP